MKITKQYIKFLFLKLCIYCLFMLGLIVLIDIFNIQHTITNRLVYWGILLFVWIWLSNKFEVSEYTQIYEESLRIWRNKRK